MRNSEETKRKLLAAARKEFAAFGIAGARVDRIAVAAGCNKQSIYQHFDSKEGLFDSVFDAMVTDTTADIPIAVDDLPTYAGRLFDRYSTDPEILRLATWSRLERTPATVAALDVGADSTSMKSKAAAVAKAQEAGKISTRIPAEHLVTLIVTMSTLQHYATGETATNTRQRKALRKSLVEAVRRLVEP
jgi:AcrR family transcriptional regulator